MDNNEITITDEMKRLIHCRDIDCDYNTKGYCSVPNTIVLYSNNQYVCGYQHKPRSKKRKED
jgi:hypothetical protein